MKTKKQLKVDATKAYKLGELAFKNGKKCVPALDTNLSKLLEGNQVGQGVQVLKAWLKGWHTANLNAPID